jgi:hypothetical protein
LSRRREGLLLALAAFALASAYVFLPSPLFYEDASRLVPELYAETFSDFFVLRHRLILPIGRLLQRTTDLPPEDALGLLSALSGAALPALTYVGLRRFRFDALSSAFGAVLLALAPTTVFYGRHIEVHGPNAAATAAAFAVVCGRNRGWSGPLSVLAVLASFAAAAGTHAAGILSCPFLGFVGASRSEGARRSALRLFALVSFLACAAGGLALLAVRTGLYAPIERHAFFPFTVNFLSGPWSFSPARTLAYAGETVIPHGALLLAAGLPGLFLLRRREPLVSLGLFAWLLAYLYPYGAWGFGKLGGYLLPTYPALALGAAEAFRLLRERRPLLAPTLGCLLVAGQAALAVRMAASDAGEPHPLAWARSLRDATGDRGVLVTDWLAHRTLARLHTSVVPITVGSLNFLPPAERPRAIGLFGDLLEREIEAGKEVYLDADLEKWLPEAPQLRPLLDAVYARFERAPVGGGAFRGWRLRKKPG